MDSKLQYVIICLVCLFLDRCFSKAEPLSGGKVEKISQASFKKLVAIAKIDKKRTRHENQLCSGYLITRNTVLTTEKCVAGHKSSELMVIAGTNFLKTSKAHTVCDWTPYNQQSSENPHDQDKPLNLVIHDIATVKLCNSVREDIVQRIQWTKKTIEELEGSSAMMVGWGKSNDHSLDNYKTRAFVKILSPKLCAEITNWRSFDSERLICTAADPYVLATPKDYGGPLLINNKFIIGITTGVFKTDGALRPGVNIHANITYYKHFLEQFP